MQSIQTRPLWAISKDIRANWENPYFGAIPYIDALSQLDNVGEKFGFDDAKSLIMYFLANASTWRGNDAKRIKAELKTMIGSK